MKKDYTNLTSEEKRKYDTINLNKGLFFKMSRLATRGTIINFTNYMQTDYLRTYVPTTHVHTCIHRYTYVHSCMHRGGGGGGDYIYFSDTDVPRENQRRAQSRGRFSHKLPTQIRGKSYML